MNRRFKNILLTSIYMLLILIAVYLVVTYVGQRIEVIGSSMEPTLDNGDNLLVDKISYRFHDPERFDIVVFPYKYGNNTYYIKRIIGLPGETVYIDKEGDIYINGEILKEGFGKEKIKNQGLAYLTITLGRDEYFVLGDNRNNSMDSRDPNVGNLHRGDIIGKAFLRIFPLNKFEIIKHR